MTFRACDQCRTRRVKCEAFEGSCGPCTKRNLVCTFRDPIQKRGPKSRLSDTTSPNNFTQEMQSPNLDRDHNSESRRGDIHRSEVEKPSGVEENPYFIDGKLTKLGLEKQLIDHFMSSLNPVLGSPVNAVNLERIRSNDPSPSETFLFFCVCTCAAMYSDLGMSNSTTLYYYSHAAQLIQIADSQRDDTYFKGLVILDYLKRYLFNTLFGNSKPRIQTNQR
ncbi:hypothetical protein K502DRAFT_323576 [Neoconidiobolus thromboides FSU 785]|nr:hypothetical protein K502DRAFT_323576 [Neoconidiobolus thromboides FSU 785]